MLLESLIVVETRKGITDHVRLKGCVRQAELFLSPEVLKTSRDAPEPDPVLL